MHAETADIDIVVNGEKRRFLEGSTLSDVIARLELPPDRVAVEFDRQIVKRELWGATTIAAGSEVEIVQFVGGG